MKETGHNEDILAEEAKAFLLAQYRPVGDMAGADEMMSTIEIYQNLMDTFPGEYGIGDVTQWLKEAGFVLQNTGQLKAFWLLKKI